MGNELLTNLKKAILEVTNDNLLDKDLSDSMLSFCESADLNNKEDVELLEKVNNSLIAIVERANDHSDNGNETTTLSNIKLEIYESEMNGEITSDERDLLLSLLS